MQTQPTVKRSTGWSGLSRSAQIGIGCAVALTLCAGCSLLAVFADAFNGNGTTQATATTQSNVQSYVQPTATVTARPRPTATPNPNAGYRVWALMVYTDAMPMSATMTSMGNDCSAGDIGACRNDMQDLNTEATAALADLKAHPAPPCLADAGKSYHAALIDLQYSSQEGMDGIDQNDVSKLQDAITLMDHATTELTNATTAAQNAQCA